MAVKNKMSIGSFIDYENSNFWCLKEPAAADSDFVSAD